MHTEGLPKNSGIQATIASLAQITLHSSLYDESWLQKLDQSAMTYLSNRKAQRMSSVTKNGDGGSHIDPLSLEGLNYIHNESQTAVLALEKQMNDFFKAKSMIQESNSRFVNQFLGTFEGSGLLELCKEAIQQLNLCVKFGECRKKVHGHKSEEMVTQIQMYFNRIQTLMEDTGSSQSQSQSDQEVTVNERFKRIGKNGRVALLLDFIQ